MNGTATDTERRCPECGRVCTLVKCRCPQTCTAVPPSIFDKEEPTMTISENAQGVRVGTLPHPAPVRASCERSVSDFGASCACPGERHDPLCAKWPALTTPPRNTTQGRRMIAVTVALSEPWDSPEIDWPETIAANLRLLYASTTVEVIDTWRTDE